MLKLLLRFHHEAFGPFLLTGNIHFKVGGSSPPKSIIIDVITRRLVEDLQSQKETYGVITKALIVVTD
jgi:hypothetical protein